MNLHAPQTALDLVAVNAGADTLIAVETYRNAANIINQSYAALGRVPVFKTTSMSTSNVKIHLDTAASATK